MLNIKKLKSGDFISTSQYLKVEEIDLNTKTVKAVNREGRNLELQFDDYEINDYYSNCCFEETKKVSRTEIARKLGEVGDKVFSISYNKLNGEERILVGNLVNQDNVLGFTSVIDLNIDPNDKSKGFRKVDNRSINYLVFNNIKYTV